MEPETKSLSSGEQRRNVTCQTGAKRPQKGGQQSRVWRTVRPAGLKGGSEGQSKHESQVQRPCGREGDRPQGTQRAEDERRDGSLGQCFPKRPISPLRRCGSFHISQSTVLRFGSVFIIHPCDVTIYSCSYHSERKPGPTEHLLPGILRPLYSLHPLLPCLHRLLYFVLDLVQMESNSV